MAIYRLLSRMWLFLSALLLAVPATASDNPAMDAQVARISSEWAHIRYRVRGKDEQVRQIGALAGQAAAVSARFKGRAEPLLWHGIVVNGQAGLAGTFQQLGLAKNARSLLERAEAIDPNAGKGGILMSLAVLYSRVPGFPLGFGNGKKAKAHFQRAMALDPDGLESNYFYGTYLAEQGNRAGARACFQRALSAPSDPRRPVWDAGRRREVREELAKMA